MRPEVRTAAGTIQGKKKKITHCGVRLYLSAGGKIGSSADDCSPIDYHQPGRIVGTDVELVTDDYIQDHPGGYTDEGDIYIESDTPLPLTVTAILFGME
jgi:hypothetical protein